MQINRPIISYEFSSLYISGQPHKEGDIPIGPVSFKNLWNFILSNKADNNSDAALSVHTRGGRKYIRTGRFVGTIQTKDGQLIEILPKIYKASGECEKDKQLCRRVFLNMLQHFTGADFKSFQRASLFTKSNFPILELYIKNYIDAVEELILGGVKKDYIRVSENLRFLKGRLDIQRHITKNVVNKTFFAIQYNKYNEDIPQNRIIVATLQKLLTNSRSNINKAHIRALLSILADIPSSKSIKDDLSKAFIRNRLFSSYEMILQWSQQFLLNKGFTNFSGSCINQSLLFKADDLFQDFIAFLFKKHAGSYTVKSQHTKYFLVDKHNSNGLFRLKPDIFIESDYDSSSYDCAIIDTKWKVIDSTKPQKNYLIDIKDMYQLYAYGKKYGQGQSKELNVSIIPKLILIYPYSENFTKQLPEFVYEELIDQTGLKIMVVPFDLSNPSSYKDQIHSIMASLEVDPDSQPIYKFHRKKSC